MKIYVVGDTHFGHTELATKYGSRPQDFERRITRKWMETVQDNDLVIHLGDVVVGRTTDWEMVTQLPGRKILTVGNHDRKSMTWYMTNGFDLACQSLSLTMFGLNIAFSHKPMDREPFDLNIHGHLHVGRHRDVPTGPRHCLFSLEENHYQPQLLKTLVERWRKSTTSG